MEISLKKNLMMKMLDQVPNLGWTWNALHEAAKTDEKAKNSNKKEPRHMMRLFLTFILPHKSLIFLLRERKN